MPRRCSRNTLPFESTTCQCGSGVPGSLKSPDSVSAFLPLTTVWVTVPSLTLAPANFLLTWPGCAAATCGATARPAITKAPLRSVDNRRRRVVCIMFDSPDWGPAAACDRLYCLDGRDRAMCRGGRGVLG